MGNIVFGNISVIGKGSNLSIGKNIFFGNMDVAVNIEES